MEDTNTNMLLNEASQHQNNIMEYLQSLIRAYAAEHNSFDDEYDERIFETLVEQCVLHENLFWLLPSFENDEENNMLEVLKDNITEDYPEVAHKIHYPKMYEDDLGIIIHRLLHKTSTNIEEEIIDLLRLFNEESKGDTSEEMADIFNDVILTCSLYLPILLGLPLKDEEVRNTYFSILRYIDEKGHLDRMQRTLKYILKEKK